MNYSLSIIAILFLTQGLCQDTIFWNMRDTLTWDDFKAVPNYASNAGAMTATGYRIEINPINKGTCVVISTFFECHRSWVFYLDSLSLAHENRHFRIAEIGRRRMIRELINTDFTGKNVNDEVKKVYARFRAEVVKMNEDFDAAVPDPRDPETEALYFQRIDTWLNELEEYSQDSVIIHLK